VFLSLAADSPIIIQEEEGNRIDVRVRVVNRSGIGSVFVGIEIGWWWLRRRRGKGGRRLLKLGREEQV
jgi:hypothetical protein